MTMRRSIAVAVLGFALLSCGSAPELATEDAATAATNSVITVTGIVDGDTVKLSSGLTVRLLGIDTPERGACGFQEASDYARTTLLSKPVGVAFDPTQDQRDRFDRSLVYLEVLGKDYSTEAARAGWAKRYVYNGKPVQKDAQIKAAEGAAQQAKAGIWGTLSSPQCAPTPTPTPTPTPAPTTRNVPPPPVVVANDDDDRRSAPAPAPKPEPKPEPEPASAYYKNCTAARAAGAAPVHRGEPGYGSHLDRDGDGVGCE